MLTRRALDLIAHYQFGAMLATKSSLILRDSKLLQQINQYASLLIGFSITCADDELSKRIERNASTTSQRFSAMAELSAKNIYTGTIMMPVIPFITDNVENIQCIIKKRMKLVENLSFHGFVYHCVISRGNIFTVG